MDRAVIYARHSPGPAQTIRSIEGQMQDCYEYARRNNIIVVGEYVDCARSGTNDQRKRFQRMIEDAKKRQFDIILVYKLDRFARNRYDSAMYRHKIKKYGVRVVSAMESIGKGPEGIMLESMLEGMAEYFSANLSQNVKRGMRVACQRGTFTGGRVPVGYKVIDKRIEINPETAPLVQEAFKRYAGGAKRREIHEWLVSRGVKTSNGIISESSLRDMLKNRKYIGETVYSGEQVPNAYPAIVSREVFDAVQKRIEGARRAPAAGKAKEEYLLQGKAFCGYCGTNLVGDSYRSGDGKTRYSYVCKQQRRQHTCEKRREQKGFLEWYIVEQTVEYVLSPERIDYIASRVVAEYNKEFGGDNLDSLERQIAKIDKEIDRCVDLMIETDSKAAVKKLEAKIDELQEQKDDLEIDLSKLRIASKIKVTEEEVKAWMQLLCKGEEMDLDFQRRIIETFINAVYVYDDRVVIYYNVKDSEQVSYMGMCEDMDDLEQGRISTVSP